MPRLSRRKKVIESLTRFIKRRFLLRIVRDQNGEDDSDEDEFDAFAISALKKTKKRRYLFRNNIRKSNHNVFEIDLNQIDEEAQALPWLTDNEFLQKYRMSRESFEYLVELIQDDPVFKKPCRGPHQAPVQHQLMVLLKFLGTEGGGSSKHDMRSTFLLGCGTIIDYCDRTVRAIRNLKDQVIKWPDSDERSKIAKRIFAEYKFPNCVGFIDGTLFPLGFQPSSEDAPDYSGRKYGYSLSTLIVCDDQRMIRYFLAGWPGSAHDNRIFKMSKLYRRPQDYFMLNEYMLGDSAFENTWFMVSAYKRAPNSALRLEQELFNRSLAGPRVRSEHTIGILKGRFPFLRQIRMRVTDDKKSLKRILRYIEVCIILHNLLTQQHDDGDDRWIHDDDFSDIDDANRAPLDDDNELNLPVPDYARNDVRRTQLTDYFNDMYVVG